jgi:hypothetical protein
VPELNKVQDDEIARQITNANPRRLLAFMPKIKPMA